MSKRRATGQLQPAVSKRHEAIAGDRARLFTARLKSLNQQFADWVKNQAASCPDQLWVDGVRHYQEYVGVMLEDFKDIVGEGETLFYKAQLSRQQDTATTHTQDAVFSTPQAAAGAGGSSRDQAAAPQTGGSTGRKSVTWADSNTALTPAPDRANGTPNPNTANAGHTPAPSGFGRFVADTPSGSDMLTPVYKLSGSGAGTPADAASTPADRNMFGSGATPFAGAGGLQAAGQTPGSPGGIAFGSGGFGTPVAAAEADADAEKDRSPRGKDSSSTPLFAFSTPSTIGAGAAGAGALSAEGGKAAPFSFATPSAAGAAAGTAEKSSTPTFGTPVFGTSSGSDKDAGKASTPVVTFGAGKGSASEPSSSPAFAFGTPSSSAAPDGGDTAGGTGKAPAFSFGVSSSSGPAAGGSSTGAGNSSAAPFSFGVTGSGAGGTTSGSGPAFSFGVTSTSGAGTSSSSGAGPAAASPPAFQFGGTGSGSGSSPAFGFGAAGSAPAFGGFGAATAANGTSGALFKFPTAAEAAGPADAGGEAAEAEEAEPEEEKTKVQAHSGWKTLFSTTAVLHMNVRSDDGKWSWQSRGKGQLSLRQPVKDNGKTYISFNSDGQGKQLVMHELKATDVSEDVPDQPLRLRMNLINTLYSVQKLEGKSLPEPVIEYKWRQCLIRFASVEVKDEFVAQVKKHTPSQ